MKDVMNGVPDGDLTPVLEALTYTPNWRDGSGLMKMGVEVNLVLRSAKALSASVFQQNCVLEGVREVRGAAIEL